MHFVKLLFTYYVWPDDGLIEISKKAETCCHSPDFHHIIKLLCSDLHYIICDTCDCTHNGDEPPKGWYEITVHWDMMPRHVVCGNQTWHETAYPPNRLSPFIKLHGVRSQKAVIVMLTTVIISCLMQGNKAIQDSSVGIVTRYGLDGPGIESRLWWDFTHRPDRPWATPSLL